MWPSEKVPIITTLAKEFALFDRWFASHPGSTYPNRQFVLSGTAHGMTDTGNRAPGVSSENCLAVIRRGKYDVAYVV